MIVGLVGWGVSALVAAVVVVPLVREYAEFRRAWGLGRAGALGVTALVLPAVAVGIAAAAPLAAWPYAQWAATVAVGLAVYSLGVLAVGAAIEPARAPQRPR